MPDVRILIPKNPERADFVQQWTKAFEREYDTTKARGQREMVEAAAEMAKHIATNSRIASVTAEVSEDGVTRLVVTATPDS